MSRLLSHGSRLFCWMICQLLSDVHPAIPSSLPREPLHYSSSHTSVYTIPLIHSSLAQAGGMVLRQPFWKVCRDLSLLAGSGLCSILTLLDLSAGFDTVDWDVLVECSEQMVHLARAASGWFRSRLRGSCSFAHFIPSSGFLSTAWLSEGTLPFQCPLIYFG